MAIVCGLFIITFFLFLYGAYGLLAGQIRLNRNKRIEGQPARKIGLILMSPLIVTFSCYGLSALLSRSGNQPASLDGLAMLFSCVTIPLAVLLALAVGRRAVAT